MTSGADREGGVRTNVGLSPHPFLGAALGLALGVAYSAIVLVLWLAGELRPDRTGTSVDSLLTAYLVGGPAAGAVVGFCTPLLRWDFGIVLSFSIGAVPLIGAIFSLTNGPPTPWNSVEWLEVMSLSLGLGGGAGFLNRRFIRSQIADWSASRTSSKTE